MIVGYYTAGNERPKTSLCFNGCLVNIRQYYQREACSTNRGPCQQ